VLFGGVAGVVGATAGGGAIGASAAFRVTRTVSFFRGTEEVCLDGAGVTGGFASGLGLSESLMAVAGRVRTGASGSQIHFRQLFPVCQTPIFGFPRKSEKFSGSRRWTGPESGRAFAFSRLLGLDERGGMG
jgi:hypothetical protein